MNDSTKKGYAKSHKNNKYQELVQNNSISQQIKLQEYYDNVKSI
jgi:hypothetical protein